MHATKTLSWTTALIFSLCAAHSAYAQKNKPEELNLVKNGHFDDPSDPLNHWLYVFDHNKHYLKNHTYVSVVEDKASMRPHVLRLDATVHTVCINQGVQVYTAPIRFDPKKKYMISLSARSIGTTGGPGPKCRIYPIGYRWHPRAVKSNNPSFADLREAVRFQVIYFNNADTGEWKRVERVIPTFGRSELQQSHLENCEWLMLKILALDATGVDKCNTGYLYVDDVKIVEIGLADEVKISAGAATKGFDGKSWTGSKPGETKPFVPIGGPKPSRKTK
ncbi:MAG TPA: hypothetical protein PLR91_07865 [Kiritimatiellia bacterium]|nr:hypothetical protein [Kiritimatiellia bacterium]